MTQTLHQRHAIQQCNNVIALRRRGMPAAAQGNPAPIVAPVPAPPPTLGERISERLWQIHDNHMTLVWLLIATLILLVDLAVIASFVRDTTGQSIP